MKYKVTMYPLPKWFSPHSSWLYPKIMYPCSESDHICVAMCQSSICLFSSGPKPLPELVLTCYHWGFVTFAWGKFHRTKRNHQHVFEKSNNAAKSPSVQYGLWKCLMYSIIFCYIHSYQQMSEYHHTWRERHFKVTRVHKNAICSLYMAMSTIGYGTITEFRT